MGRIRSGPSNSLVDVPGIEVGHDSDLEGLTGVTAVLVRNGATAAVDVRGAAPGTRETDLLAPENLVQRVQAIVLAGGSAFGLDTASGVVRYLEERGLGQSVGGERVVPIVPAAVIFDLDVGDWRARPSAESGYRAADAASSAPVAQGSVGAGTGAKAGGLRGGVGSASAVLPGGVIVAALAVVNSLGRVCDERSGRPYAAELEVDGEYQLSSQVEGPVSGDEDYEELFPAGASLAGRNTTIGVVATNAALDKAQALKLAQMAHSGLARAVRPSHTPFDGDAIFALATGEKPLEGPLQLARLGSVGADVFARAIFKGIASAGSTHASSSKVPPSYRSVYPGRTLKVDGGEG